MKNNNNNYIENFANSSFRFFLEKIDFQRLGLLDYFNNKIKELKKNSLFANSLVNTIYNEFCNNIDKLFEKETNAFWELNKTVSQKTVFNNCDYNTLYEWKLEDGANHCADCVERSGQKKTYAEWEAIGVPGSGVTKCNYNCLCDLIEIIKK